MSDVSGLRIYAASAIVVTLIFTVTTFNIVGSFVGGVIVFALMLMGATHAEKQKRG